MGMPENILVEFPLNEAGDAAVVGTVDISRANVAQLFEKGYDFTKGVGAAWTAVLEGSVSGDNWASIDALAASAQGSISAHFNRVRLRVTVGGAIGTGTKLVIAGKY